MIIKDFVCWHFYLRTGWWLDYAGECSSMHCCPSLVLPGNLLPATFRRSRRWRWSRFGWILQNSTSTSILQNSTSSPASQALKRWGVIWYCPIFLFLVALLIMSAGLIFLKMLLNRTHKGCRCTGCPAMHIGPSNDILPDSNFGNNNTRVYFHPFACHFALVWVRPSDILTAGSNFCWPSLKNGYIT